MDIIGLWSANIFYYDAFEEYMLCFKDDGYGFYNYSRPSYDEIDTFSWKIEDGKLIFNGINRIVVQNEKVIEKKKSVLAQEILLFKGIGKTITSKVVDVIEFPDEVIFGDVKYGLIEKNPQKSNLYTKLEKYTV